MTALTPRVITSHYRATEELYEQLMKYARNNGITMNEASRRLVAVGLAQQTGEEVTRGPVVLSESPMVIIHTADGAARTTPEWLRLAKEALHRK